MVLMAYATSVSCTNNNIIDTNLNFSGQTSTEEADIKHTKLSFQINWDLAVTTILLLVNTQGRINERQANVALETENPNITYK